MRYTLGNRIHRGFTMRYLAHIVLFVVLLAPAWASAKGKTELTLRLPAEGARILVDGKQVVKRASQEVTITVAHGKHRLQLELDGYESVERNITLRSSATSMDIKMVENLPLGPGSKPAAKPGAFALPTAESDDLPLPSAAEAVTTPVPVDNASNLRIAVMEVPSGTGISSELAAALTSAILEDTQKRPAVSAVGQQDLFYRLTSEQRAKVRACKDETCFTTLGFNLFVDEVLISRITALPESLLLTVERLDITKGIVRGTSGRSAPAGHEEKLLVQLVPALDELYGDKPVAVTEVAARGPSLEAISRFETRPPLHRGLFIATGSTAVVVAAVGGIFGALSNANMKAYNSATTRAAVEPMSAGNLNDLRSQSVAQAQVANTTFIVAGVLAVGAGIEAIFTNWNDRPVASPTPETKPVALHLTPGGLQLTWR